AGDADHGQAELAAMPGRKGLQRLPRVLHLDHAQPAILRYLPALYQEAAGTPLAQRVDVAVPVVVLAAEGDEQGVLGMPRLARINGEVRDVAVGTVQLAAHGRGDRTERPACGHQGKSVCLAPARSARAASKQGRHSGS